MLAALGHRMTRLAAALFALLIFAMSQSAVAQDGFYIDEVRFGGTWVQPEWLYEPHREQEQAGIAAEILFGELNFDSSGRDSGILHSLLTPRPHLGGLLVFDDNGTDYVYGGLTWQFDITQRAFLELGFGGGINNGRDHRANRAILGSRVLFRESVALGFAVTERTNLVLQVEHLSHANLAGKHNDGLTNASVRLGVKF